MEQNKNNSKIVKGIKKSIGKIYDGFLKQVGSSIALAAGAFFGLYFGGQEISKTIAEVIPKSDSAIIVQGDDTTRIVTKSFSKPIFIVNNKKDFEAAKEYELKGFKALADRDFDLAFMNFRESENSANRYHASYEITKYLLNHENSVSEPNFWKKTYSDMIQDEKIRDYIPSDIRKMMDEYIRSHD